MIPFFVVTKPVQITHLAACRQRSVAACNDTSQVFEWGYLNSAKSDAD
jgi:hypothetical protein